MSKTTYRRQRVVDAAIVAAVLCLSWLSTFVTYDIAADQVTSPLPAWGNYVLAVAMTVPLAWRRRWPLGVLAVVGPIALVAFAVDMPDPWGPTIALFLALYTAGAIGEGPRRDPLRAAVSVGTIALVIYAVFSKSEYVGFDQVLLGGYLIVVNGGFLILAWLLGDAARTRTANERELERRARELAENQRQREQQAVMAERVRVARELHDVVAHHVSVMGIQASAAQRVFNSDEAAAREALRTVEQSGRDAVAELGRMVGLLRQSHPDDELSAAPQPTLEELDRLVAGSGLPVTIRRVGKVRPVPASVALSAYRIVQESLTNVLKHAGHVGTTVVVTYAEDHLQVEVVNDRGTSSGTAPGLGRGLLGVRERAAMLGGHSTHGPVGGGGFRVQATLPTPPHQSQPAGGVA